MNKRGVILIECLIALLVMQVLVTLLFVMAKNIIIESNHQMIQDEIMLYKLKRIFVVASDIEYYDEYISYAYKNNHYQLEYKNNKLVITPGTQIVIDDITELYFQNQGFYYCKFRCRWVDLHV